VEFIEADMLIPDDCRRVVAQAVKRFERVDGLVNCAGDTTRGSLETTTVELWDKLMNTNLRAPFILSQEISKHMKEKKIMGSIVNISSIASHTGAPFIMTYSVTKAALNTMTKNNAMELRPWRIRVNSINMGWTYTDNEDILQTKQKGGDWLEKAEEKHPFGRLLRSDDITNTVLFLLSDGASMISGAVIDVHPEFIAGMMPDTVG